jgi:hypothetical protein
MTTTAINVRAIGTLLLLTVVAAICAVLSTSSPALLSKGKPGDGCVQVAQKVANRPIVRTRICFPDIPFGQ